MAAPQLGKPSKEKRLTVKAALLHKYGQPLTVEEIPRPAPEPDEILLQVEACGVCHSDLHMMEGDWPGVVAALELPAILGHEAVGRVVEAGADVKDLRVGDRVGVGWIRSTCGECEHCREGHENVCLKRQVTSIAAPGGYAEFMRAKASHAIRVPEGLASHDAAPFFCAGVTVLRACRNAGIRAGQQVAVFGIGGLGHLAIQVAKQLGAEVTAVDLADDKLALARSLGADRTVNASAGDAARQIRSPVRPQVAVVTAASKAAYDLALRTLRRRGTLAVVGLPKEKVSFVADDFVVGEYHIVGSAVGTRADLRDVLGLAAAGKVRCQVETCRLDDLNQIFARMRRGELAGRAVVTF